MCASGWSDKDKERNQCLVILITGALQNVNVLQVTREAADKANNNNHIPIKGSGEEKQEEKPRLEGSRWKNAEQKIIQMGRSRKTKPIG